MIKHDRKPFIFTPGPVPMDERTLVIGGEQTPYFRNEAFSQVVLECENGILETLNAPEGSRVLFFAASGTGAMEATITNLVLPHERVLTVIGGGFGERFADMARFHNIETEELYVEDDDLSDVEPLNSTSKSDVLLLNAHETSIGLLYDVDSIGQWCHANNMFFIVDAISMYITDPLDMNSSGIDAVILSSHKGLALPPGLAMVVLSPKAIEKVGQISRSFYFDFSKVLEDGRRGQTPFTPPVTIMLQLQERMQRILKEGIEQQWVRTAKLADYFRKAIEPLPLAFYCSYMPNAMSALIPTDGKSAYKIVEDLEVHYNVVLTPNGGELRDKLFRVGHMGAMDQSYIDVLIDALYDYYKIKREK